MSPGLQPREKKQHTTINISPISWDLKLSLSRESVACVSRRMSADAEVTPLEKCVTTAKSPPLATITNTYFTSLYSSTWVRSV